MSTEQAGLRFEIGHVLFIDIVGYSRLLITEQSELLRKLTATIVKTEQFRIAEAEQPGGARALRSGSGYEAEISARTACADGNPQRPRQRSG